MKPLLISVIFISIGFSQNTPAYPTRIATTTDIPLASENFTTVLTLTTPIGTSDTAITVTTTTGSLVPIILYLDPNTAFSESILCTSKSATQFTTCTRGFNSTGAKSHNGGAVVANNVSPYYINQHSAEIISVETDLFNAFNTPKSSYFVLHGVTPIATAIPTYVDSTVSSKLAPSVCTITASTITCPLTGSTSMTLGTPTAFASLGTATQGKVTFCNDCNVVASPFTCTSGGGGAWAFANGTVWKCPF